MAEVQTGTRRRARELAFRVLFEAEQGGNDINTAWENAKLEVDEKKESRDRDEPSALDSEGMIFAHRLVLGFDEKRYEVDQTLERVIEGWTFTQMSQTDLTILRISSYEMMFLDTPHPVVIEMAVRIAKRYGGEESGKFVNGVLARLIKHLDKV
jgi:transcription antitermination protein NusB